MNRPAVNISIDTEEDDWGSYARSGATTENIGLLPRLQEIFDRWEARPTYFANHAPLTDPEARRVLRALAERESVEIGVHCHPWNTPPFTDADRSHTMMCRLEVEENRAKIAGLFDRAAAELGRRPTSFRAGRWGFGPTVAEALRAEGVRIDSSVSPFMDWSNAGGPDYHEAPHRPYRFEPGAPFAPDPSGSMVELPVTIGSFRGNHVQAARRRRRLERSLLGRLKIVGLIDRAGFMTQRWLSPEMLDGPRMVRLGEASVRAGEPLLAMTFHSCALLPGATPFVRTEADQRSFLQAIEHFVRHCAERGYRFVTVSELGGEILDAA